MVSKSNYPLDPVMKSVIEDFIVIYACGCFSGMDNRDWDQIEKDYQERLAKKSEDKDAT